MNKPNRNLVWLYAFLEFLVFLEDFDAVFVVGATVTGAAVTTGAALVLGLMLGLADGLVEQRSAEKSSPPCVLLHASSPTLQVIEG